MVNNWREAVNLSILDPGGGAWSKDELLDEIKEAVHESADLNFEQNGGYIATTLSGGIDSSLCLALIREYVGDDVRVYTFTIGKSAKHPDVGYAREVSELFHTIHHEFVPSREDLARGERELNLRFPKELMSAGDLAVYLIYERLFLVGVKSVIAHDGIDELMGGYWDHREQNGSGMLKAFEDRWRRLENEHLIPLEQKASSFGIQTIFPYLQVPLVRYISRIPLENRTSRVCSKILLRQCARNYLPLEIIDRKKVGFCSALENI